MRVVRPCDGHARRHHVGITDRPNLLESVATDQTVEHGKDFVEDGYRLCRSLMRGANGETSKIRKQNRDVVVVVRDGLFASLETGGDRLRKNVQQQSLLAPFGRV